MQVTNADAEYAIIEPHDVAVLVLLLKVARLINSPEHMDNWTDIAGYAACGWEAVISRDEAGPAERMFSHTRPNVVQQNIRFGPEHGSQWLDPEFPYFVDKPGADRQFFRVLDDAAEYAGS